MHNKFDLICIVLYCIVLYCIAECKARVEHVDDDGLDLLVNSLKPCFTSRFGEVCWAQGGTL